MGQYNGLEQKVYEIHANVREMKDDLSGSISLLTEAIRELSNKVHVATENQKNAMQHTYNSVPMRFVVYLFFLFMLAFDRGELAKTLVGAVVSLKDIFVKLLGG